MTPRIIPAGHDKILRMTRLQCHSRAVHRAGAGRLLRRRRGAGAADSAAARCRGRAGRRACARRPTSRARCSRPAPAPGIRAPTRRSPSITRGGRRTADVRQFGLARASQSTFGLDEVITGWTEGVQMMVEGEKRRFWIPGSLAYDGAPGTPAGHARLRHRADPHRVVRFKIFLWLAACGLRCR